MLSLAVRASNLDLMRSKHGNKQHAPLCYRPDNLHSTFLQGIYTPNWTFT